MAILREGIAAANNCVDQMRVASKELADVSTEIMTALNSNNNFQIFKDGTDRGESIYNSLNTCVSTIVDKLVPTIDKISMSTTELLNNQYNLNRADISSTDEGIGWR